MRSAAIAYRNSELQAREHDDLWTVCLAGAEASSSYLDVALAEVLGNAPEAHRVAARLLMETGEEPEPRITPPSQRPRRVARRRDGRARLALVGLRIVVLGLVTSTAFMLTTWLNAIW